MYNLKKNIVSNIDIDNIRNYLKPYGEVILIDKNYKTPNRLISVRDGGFSPAVVWEGERSVHFSTHLSVFRHFSALPGVRSKSAARVRR